jgi:hypothetical protein
MSTSNKKRFHEWAIINIIRGEHDKRLSIPRAVTKSPTAAIRRKRRQAMKTIARFPRSPLAVAIVVPMTIMTLSKDKEVDIYREQG